MGGEFEIVVVDANGCTVKDTVTIIEPAPWTLNVWYEDPSDCNIPDGKVWGVIEGGFDTLDIPGVEVLLTLNGETVSGGPFVMGDTVLLLDTAVYDVAYTVTAINDAATIPGSIEFAEEI